METDKRPATGADGDGARHGVALAIVLARAIEQARALAARHESNPSPDLRVPPSRMAPELTGRTQSPADHRADLYAFGASLYEWVTGAAPFDDTDPLRIAHAHLAQIPKAPRELRPELPEALSRIVMRLLEKNPGDRYQSAAAVVHDLQNLADAIDAGADAAVTLGEVDVPLLLAAPQRPIGREREIGQLRSALASAHNGKCELVLIAGAAGTGKTMLAGELRHMLASSRGLYSQGKFDQYSRSDAGGLVAALRGLGRHLLAAPADEMLDRRRRILEATGSQAGVLRCIPDIELVLGALPEPPESGPADSMERMTQVFLALVGAVASPDAPVVLQLDDLQWADETSLRFIGSVLDAPNLRGVVVAGTYRDDDLDEAHALAKALQRWRARPDAAPQMLRLGALDEEPAGQVLASMLRTPLTQVRSLAGAVRRYTHGNPFDTVEAINALRGAGILVLRPGGWAWDSDSVERHLGKIDLAADLIDSRIARLSAGAWRLARTLSFMNHEMSPASIRIGYGAEQREIDAQLAELTREGVLLRHEEPLAFRWRHDRFRHAIRETVPEDERGRIHLVLARNLAAEAATAAEAAEHYVAAEPLVEPRECVFAAARLRDGAARARAVANHDSSAHMLRAALRLLARAPSGEGDTRLRLECEIDLHLALISLGRLDEADEVFARVRHIEPDPGRWGHAARHQLISLFYRSFPDAAAFGLDVLRLWGAQPPADPAAEDTTAMFRRATPWLEAFDVQRELRRPELTEPGALGLAEIVECATWIGYPRAIGCWAILESQRMWDRHGPCGALAIAISTSIHFAAWLGEWRLMRVWAPKILAFAQGRQWRLEGATLTLLVAVLAKHWFAPIEEALDDAIEARKELRLAGRLDDVADANENVVHLSFDCGFSLDACRHELDTGMEFANRHGMGIKTMGLVGTKQLDRALRGETLGAGSFDDETFSERERLTDLLAQSRKGYGRLYLLRRAIACAIFGDARMLAACAGGLGASQGGFYATALVAWLSGLGATWTLSPSAGSARDAELERLIAEFRPVQDPGPDAAFRVDDEAPVRLRHIDHCVRWLDARAADSPANFRHMHFHLLAERAWATGDSDAAARHFESALHAVSQVSRPWHRALITERAARFRLQSGDAKGGEELIAEALRQYELWGAHGKVRQLREQFPSLAPQPADAHALDLMAVLRASQAISAEHSVTSLQQRVVQVLGELTGATRVTLALRDAHTGAWLIQEQGASTPVEQAADRLPLAAFMYATRTLEPLVLPDALADDRFARDPYWQGIACCSLLVLPILHKGDALAMLVLENRAVRGAFNEGRLDAAKMIATQLAVSLDSAQLYDRMQTLYAAMNQAPDAMLVVDPDTLEYVDVNEAAARNFGLTREKMLRMGMRKIVDVQHDATAEEVRALYRTLIETHPQPSRTLHAFTVPGQPPRTLETTRSAVRQNGKWLIVIVSRDVTERERINRELNERVSDLARSNRELEQFAYVTSHDLTEPLRMVASYAQLLERRYADKLGDDGREFTRFITDGAKRMKALIDDILVYSRAGRANRRIGTHALDKLLDAALANLRVAIADTSAIIERPDALPALECDATGITMVLQNLVANALKFRGEQAPVVRVSAIQDEGSWTICVADNGIGIEPRYFERIFTMFQRLHGRDRYEGTGIGLSICKKVVESHGGTIWVESAPGAGARFYFTIPSAAPTA